MSDGQFCRHGTKVSHCAVCRLYDVRQPGHHELVKLLEDQRDTLVAMGADREVFQRGETDTKAGAA